MCVPNKYRSVEFIESKINSIGSFENYMNSISINTARNYKTPIEGFIGRVNNKGEKLKYKKILDDKISSLYDNSFKEASEAIEKILKELNNLYKESERIFCEEDEIFLISIICMGLKIERKEIKSQRDINVENINGTISLKIGNSDRHIIKKEAELFIKALDSFCENEKISRKIEKEIVQKYIYSKNNFKKANMMNIKKVMSFYFYKTLKDKR